MSAAAAEWTSVAMTEAVLLMVGLIAGLGAGFAAAWLASSSRVRDLQSRLAEAQSSFDAKSEFNRQKIESLQQQILNETTQKVKAQTETEQLLQSLEDQRKLIQDAETRLVDTFSALSHRALASNNQSFLELAKSTFSTLQTQAKGELETRKQSIDGLVKPLQQSLERYDQKIATIDKQWNKEFGGLTAQLGELQTVTGTLNNALRNPQSRGRWGEMTLKNAVNLSGMSEYCGDFTQQKWIEGEDGDMRPDMIVHLPSNRNIVVDAKAPLDAYMGALEASNEAEKEYCYRRYSKHVRDHMKKLAKKSYWEQLDKATDFVVLFLPGESFLATALKYDKTLMEHAWDNRVLMASPLTLIALLQTVAYGWREEKLAKNAQEISKIGKTLYRRISIFAKHIKEMGNQLEKAVKSFNDTAGALEKGVLVYARMLKDKGAGEGDEIEQLQDIESTPRQLNIAETDEANEADEKGNAS
jgi:DNA recombination protein RmuC